jgi:periplasmic divalent cation tolerance protein
MSRVVLVLTTVPEGSLGEEIASVLVGERLAACVNVCAPLTSLYRWKDAVERDTECQLVIKTTDDRVAAVQERVNQLHSYELPEFLVLEATGGSDAYLNWVAASARSET